MAAVTESHGAFGPYRIIRRLGAGGMAEVFLAERTGPADFSQTVCLKRVLGAYSDNPEFTSMFLAEARLLARLNNANIVHVYDFGEVGGSYYLAMEYVDGVDLRKLLGHLKSKQTSLAPALVAHVAHEILRALAYVHGLEDDDGGPLGLVHRDLSPANVLVSLHGEVKLADFGIAKATNASATRSGQVKGKISYMAPEQLELRPERRSDLFSLGVMLYEMLAGKRPFDGPTEIATMRNVIEGKFVRLADAVPDVSDVLAGIVDRLLAARPEDRFESAEATDDALMEVLPPPSARRELAALVRACRRLPERAPAAPEPPSGVHAAGAAPSGEPSPDAVVPTPSSEAASPQPEARPLPVEEDAFPKTRPLLEAGAIAPEPRRAGRRVGPWGVVLVLLVIGAIAAVAAIGLGADDTGSVETAAGGPTPAELLASRPLAPAGDEGTTVDRADDGSMVASAVVDNGESSTRASSLEDPERASAGEGAMEEGALGATGPTATEVDLDGEERPREATQLARIRVHALPFGDVWIDGRRAGSTPFERAISPGRHRIEAGRGRPEQGRTVNLRPGERRSFRFDLVSNTQ